MSFNSLEFLLFFPIATFIYFLLPHRWRWVHLLAASCLFYMWFIPVYIFILFFIITVDYIAGILIEGANGPRRKGFLVMSIIANVGILSLFKYDNFLAGLINDLLRLVGLSTHQLPYLNLLLPIGLSFHTFQAMSYTIEVYRGHQPAERHFGIYALYVMFYPQLVAGPIERPQHMLPQFHERKRFNAADISSGLRLMMWGMFKKVVIADRLAEITGPIFNAPHSFTPMALLIATSLFSFQIYCDFSGYSDIALGSARVMGFRLMQNFNMPYHSRSLPEFWRRWHISLTSWFRDYLYLPLGGNRVSTPRWCFNLFFVFLISGVWHGANITFVIWGALHGTYIIIFVTTQKFWKQLVRLSGLSRIHWLYDHLRILLTFTLVSIAWPFFRGNNLSEGYYFFSRIPEGMKELASFCLHGNWSWEILKFRLGNFPVHGTVLALSIFLIGALETIQFLQRRYDLSLVIQREPVYIRWTAYYMLIAVILFCGVFGNKQFIYFQF